jgi:hypothetical protein
VKRKRGDWSRWCSFDAPVEASLLHSIERWREELEEGRWSMDVHR